MTGGPLPRRAFLGVLAAAAIGLVAFYVWRRREAGTAERIRAFFALEARHGASVEGQLRDLRGRSLVGFAATLAFFSLEATRLARLVPRPARAAVVEHWSRRLLARRSLGWPWLGYPSAADVAVCDGLIRSAA